LLRLRDSLRQSHIVVPLQEMLHCVGNTGESRSDHNIKMVLGNAFKVSAFSETRCEKMLLWQQMDTDKDGKVSITEWMTYFNNKQAKATIHASSTSNRKSPPRLAHGDALTVR
jgi:hypothetical protein